MRPTDYPFQPEQLRAWWEQFMATGAVAEAARLDPLVLASWRRCRLRLDPWAPVRPAQASSEAWPKIQQRGAELLSVALPQVEDIYQYIQGVGCALILTNGAGCALTLQSDPAMLSTLRRLRLGVGTYWAEGRQGTNALGLSLITAMPTQVVGPEHYHQHYHNLATTAAPIHHTTGQLIGLIAVVTPAAAATPILLALVMSSANAISNQLRSDALLEAANQHLSRVSAILEVVTDGVLMWDETGRIHHCNVQAAQMLGTPTAVLLGRSVHEVISWPTEVAERLEQGLGLDGVETTLQMENRLVTCLLTLRPVVGGVRESPPLRFSYVALLRPVTQVRRLVNQQSGAPATVTFNDVLGHSPAIRQTVRQARIAARGATPVLISGESGVGKTYLAQAIHTASPRSHKPLLTINCRAIPHDLLPGEMLGVESDGSSPGRPSKFELADGGTLVLNQVHYLPLEMQHILLDVIDRRHVMRLNGVRPIPVNVRIVATTQPNPQELVPEGMLIPELYYRLSIYHFVLLPLRQRSEDIPVLAHAFVQRGLRRQGRQATLADDALAALCRYPWPGNVRELEGILERALMHSQGDMIRLLDLPERIRKGRVLRPTSPDPQPLMTVEEAEREAIIRAGWACQGRVSLMAETLGMGRTTLWRKLKHLHLNPADFKMT